MEPIIKLLILADELDRSNCFAEADLIDELILLRRRKKPGDDNEVEQISKSFKPISYDVVQSLSNI